MTMAMEEEECGDGGWPVGHSAGVEGVRHGAVGGQGLLLPHRRSPPASHSHHCLVWGSGRLARLIQNTHPKQARPRPAPSSLFTSPFVVVPFFLLGLDKGASIDG